jgi:putative membrane protein
MQKPLLAALCTLLLPCAAFPAAAQSFPEQVGFVSSSPGNQTAKDFVQAVMMSDKFAIVTGKLALERSQNQAIRAFASDMIAAHRKIETDMKRITDRSFVNRRVTPPPVFDPDRTKLHRALLVSYGPAFDRLYVSQQIQIHQELLDYLEGYADKGGYRPLQDFARKMVPVVRGHQAMLSRIHLDGPPPSGAVAAR